MADVLTILREWAQGQRSLRKVDLDGRQCYIFGDVAYDKDASTNMTVYNKEGDLYSIESAAATDNVRAVTRPDRRELLEYLEGERQEHPSNYSKFLAAPPTIPVSRFEGILEPECKRMRLDTEEAAPRLAQLLDEDTESAVTKPDDSNIRALSENLSADKVAALRKKMQNHQKRTNTNALAEIEMVDPTAAKPRSASDFQKKERVWRTRANCLEAHAKQFSAILTLLQSIKTREETEVRNRALGIPPPSKNGGPTVAQQMVRDANRGYSRYDQEQFNNDDFEEDFTFLGKHAALQQNSTSKTKPPSSTSRIPTHPQHHGYPPSKPMSYVQKQAEQAGLKKRTSRTPIIIIPSSTNAYSLISMYNVRDVLQDLSFVTMEAKKASGAKRENEILIQRRKADQTISYRVVDNPMRLNDEEWDRVVAVFAMGPNWQFKGWRRWHGNPAEIFANVAGFHLTYDDIKLEPNVSKWSVKIIALSRVKRHLDRARIQIFWDILDSHIAKTKPHLRF